MKEFYGNYLGVVITGGEKDPEHRGRAQVFVPHIMPALYEQWNKEGKDISFEVIGTGLDGALDPKIVNRLRDILPWAECAAPITGASPSYKGSTGGFVSEITRNVGAAVEAVKETAGQVLESTKEFLGLAGEPVATISPKDKVSSGAHLDVRWTPGTKEKTDVPPLDLIGKYIAVGGIPADQLRVTDGPTGPGGKNFGSGRSLERHPAWDLAFQQKGTIANAPVTLMNGAKLVYSKDSESMGSAYADIETPDGKIRLYHLTTGSVGKVSKPTQSPSATGALNNTTNLDPDPTNEKKLSEALNQQLSVQSTETPATQSFGSIDGVSNASRSNFSTSSGSGNPKLASDRQAKFAKELQDPAILERLSYLTWQEVDRTGSASAATGTKLDQQANFIETVVNRAYFDPKGRSLSTILNESAYGFKSGTSKINPTTQKAFEAVMAGRNNTNLATDNASNQYGTKKITLEDGTEKIVKDTSKLNPVARNRIDAGVTGTWYENGVAITDPARIAELRSLNETPNGVEFFYRANGAPGYRTGAGLSADKYAKENGIEATTGLASAAISQPTIKNPTPHQGVSGPNTNNQALGMFGYASEGQAVWVFFREGNPLCPVYFATSFGSKEWGGIYQNQSNALGSGIPGTELMRWNSYGGTFTSFSTTEESPMGANFGFQLSDKNGSNLTFAKDHTQFNSLYNHVQRVHGDSHDITETNKEVRVRGNYNTYTEQDLFITVGNWSQEALDASDEIQKIINDGMKLYEDS